MPATSSPPAVTSTNGRSSPNSTSRCWTTPEWGKINANVAGRYTHYTTSGDVETWKVALLWDTPLDGLRLRALQSRDVRAPNLAELFAGARVNNGSVTDPFTCCSGSPPLTANKTISPLPNPITANPFLKPEKGQTTEVGLVWSPTYVPGLNLSATYWRIGIKSIIGQLGQGDQINLCFNGNAFQCSFISARNGAALGGQWRDRPEPDPYQPDLADHAADQPGIPGDRRHGL